MSGPTGQSGSAESREGQAGGSSSDGASGSNGSPGSAPVATQDGPSGNGQSGGGQPGGGGGGRRGLKRSTRLGLIVIVVIALVAGGIFAASYMLNTRNYVSTDNATIDGDNIDLNAPASGYVQGWNVTEGTPIHAGQTVARIRIIGGFVQPQQAIRAPADATVAQNNTVEGAYVTAGTQLAVAYDLSQVYVTARVDETDVDSVHAGQRVDFTVDAFPGYNFTGVVREVQDSSAGQFSLFPQSNTSGNFQKVTQVIPVKIAIDDRFGLELVPGMNVNVDIHKR